VDPLELPASIADNATTPARFASGPRSSKLESGARDIPSKSHAAVDTEPIESSIPAPSAWNPWRTLASLSLHHRIGEPACTSNLQAVSASKEIQLGYGLLQMIFGLSGEVIARPFLDFQKITHVVSSVAHCILGLCRRSGMGHFRIEFSTGLLQSKSRGVAASFRNVCQQLGRKRQD
jgi:hypothetical protein